MLIAAIIICIGPIGGKYILEKFQWGELRRAVIGYVIELWHLPIRRGNKVSFGISNEKSSQRLLSYQC